MSKITLACSQDEFHAVCDVVDRARAGTENVTVPRAALVALLRDHRKLIDHHKESLGGVL